MAPTSRSGGRDLFDVVAAGHDGAIGSRFTHESILINYPFFKTLCNRSCHVLVTLLLGKRVRDISNNLKLYRAEILKNLDIEQPHFAANVETGLKPLLAGYDVVDADFRDQPHRRAGSVHFPYRQSRAKLFLGAHAHRMAVLARPQETTAGDDSSCAKTGGGPDESQAVAAVMECQGLQPRRSRCKFDARVLVP